ncbi:hypothetical protein RND81_07G154300 [Saponaria officinalis]|uniref:Uncharacterized protein n=1 Tax=Saponaria officinalis TaxID=3572 RepID=A0AAW1JQP9_SAPOF
MLLRINWLVVNIMLVWGLRVMAQTESEYMIYKDPQQLVVARVKDLLSRMTLEEKIGQMTQIDRTMALANIMKTYSIGDVSQFQFFFFCWLCL